MFELRNLATGILGGDTTNITLAQFGKQLADSKNGKMGRVFCSFGKPINLKDFLASRNFQSIGRHNIEEASLQLTNKLYTEQQFACKINLTMVVASLLLQEQAKQVDLTQIVFACNRIYQYFTGRRINTSITLEPQTFAVQQIVKGLGFTINKKVQEQGKNKNELEVLLQVKEDQKTVLGLCYYRNQMLQHLVMDSNICF